MGRKGGRVCSGGAAYVEPETEKASTDKVQWNVLRDMADGQQGPAMEWGTEHVLGTCKDLGLYSRSPGKPFKCLYRGMTCSELPFEKKSQGCHVKDELQDTGTNAGGSAEATTGEQGRSGGSGG